MWSWVAQTHAFDPNVEHTLLSSDMTDVTTIVLVKWGLDSHICYYLAFMDTLQSYNPCSRISFGLCGGLKTQNITHTHKLFVFQANK